MKWMVCAANNADTLNDGGARVVGGHQFATSMPMLKAAPTTAVTAATISMTSMDCT
jgi:hypothetical protein